MMGAAPADSPAPEPAAQYRVASEAYARGDFAAAIAALRALIRRAPDHAEALNLLGIIGMQGGRAAEAEALFARAVAARPGEPGFHNSHAGALHALGRGEEALAAFGRALALDPDYAGARLNLGRLLEGMGRIEEALPHYERLCALRPEDADAHFLRGGLLYALRRYEPAVQAFQRVLALRPAYPGARLCLGNALWGAKRAEAALAEYDAVIAADADAAGARANRSVVLIDLGRPAEALADIERALALKPGNPDFHNLHGNALHALNRHREARAAYGRALALFPEHRNARFNTGLCHLVECEFAAGWRDYEARWQTGLNLGRIDSALPEWDGAPTRTPVLVWGEQGIGDQILQLSVAEDVARLAPNAVFALMPRLLPLARRSYPALRFIGLDQCGRAGCGAQKAFWSAAALVRRGLHDFPGARAAYLCADPARVAALRSRIAGDGRPVIGLSWQSRAVLHSRLKSMPLATLQPLLADARWCFADLQYGDTAADRAAVQDIAAVRRLDDIDPINDIDGLAALAGACDAVVTISNVTAHLAGALGVPTLLLLPWSTGRQWYWHDAREDSPWYPRLAILRQSAPLRWDDVVARACAALPRLLEERVA
jgi:tetratricopeptide (TPR) repeat protein